MSGTSTQIKICGLRDAASAVVAADAGANYLGFNFVDGSKRQISAENCIVVLDEYRWTKKPQNDPAIVGLFRNHDPAEVNRIARAVGFDYLQLCGDEDDEYIANMELPIFKQVFVKPEMTSADVNDLVSPFLESGHGIVLDSFSKGFLGGSGKTFNWDSAMGVANRERVLLAGGLNPENVGSAIEQLGPWGVDVASGVEIDGVKDPDRIRAFIAAAQSA